MDHDSNASELIAQPAEGIRPSYAYTVGLLLLVIIAALTGITLSLRQRAMLAEQQAARQLQQQQANLQMLLGSMALPLQESDLTVIYATFNNRLVKVQVVQPDRAASLGLAPGEILLVGQSSETAPAPATEPAGVEPQ